MDKTINYDWSNDKNETLKRQRGVSFEDVIFHIERGDVLDIVDHPNYPNQNIYIVRIEDYAYEVPFVQTGCEIFLKTIYPSRKATRDYLYGDKSVRSEDEQGDDTARSHQEGGSGST